MIISGAQFKNYAESLNQRLKGKHISRPTLVARSTLFFHLSGKEEHRFVISLESGSPRAYLADEDKNLVSIDSPIYALFRKELSNAFIEKVGTENDDRILKFNLITVNSVYKEERRYLYFEMFTTHPNLILCERDNKIIAFTHGSSLESKRPIMKGLAYLAPAKGFVENGNEPFDYLSYQKDCLSKESEIFTSRKKERFGFLVTSFKNKEKRLKRKLVLMEKDKANALSHLNDSLFGDYIYTNYSSLNGVKEIEVDGKKAVLDTSKSLSYNANAFYKKAKKAKKALEEIDEQTLKVNEELTDVSQALSLLSQSDEEGLEAFAKEWGLYSKKDDDPSFGSSNIPYSFIKNGTTFLFGKTAKQNDTLTFLIDTVKTHYWFHCDKTHGAHVMIRKDEPNDEEIRTACEIALISSIKKDGDVMMSERKNVYKGSVPGQAIVRHYETVHLKSVRPETEKLFLAAKKMNLRNKE